MPRTIVLDPMLRAIADIPWDYAAGHAATVRNVLASLPAVDDSAGVPLTAPLLIVPRVFDFQLCEVLIQFYQKLGGEESGFLLDVKGQTTRVVDHRLKRRSDLTVAHPQLREAIRSQIVRRLLAAIGQFFQFQATRMDRTIVACYDSAVGGHFYRHRDNVNIGAQHRRFAITINLNKDYEGCDLVLPEFGRRAYRTDRRRDGVFMRRAASGDAGHQRAALCLSCFSLWRGGCRFARSQQCQAASDRGAVCRRIRSVASRGQFRDTPRGLSRRRVVRYWRRLAIAASAAKIPPFPGMESPFKSRPG
jgi:hypothetical protein